jgi:hypothetical protein
VAALADAEDGHEPPKRNTPIFGADIAISCLRRWPYCSRFTCLHLRRFTRWASLERPDGEPYELSIVLVYSPGDDAEASGDAAEELAATVKEACEARLNKGNAGIVIRNWIAISEDDLTVSRARVLSHWRLEHMTLKSHDNHPGAV